MGNKLCIIPARGGSKRIPKKNIKKFLDKPIISYSIIASLDSGLFDEVMVSTDDPEISKIALRYGANVPFLRSQKSSDDHATTVDVLLEVVHQYQEKGINFDMVCCLYPCAPFVSATKLRLAIDALEKNDYSCIFPVMPFSFPIQRALKIEDDRPRFFFPEYELARSQDLEKAYHDAGQFYFLKTKSLIESRTLISDKTGVIKISELEAQDIDNESDWKLAELKYKLICE